jgi:hypothetical protein
MQLKIALIIGSGLAVVLKLTNPQQPGAEPAALYLEEHRHVMTSEDYRRFSGAGLLFCRDGSGVFQKAAAAWLIGNRSLVMMNAHNFRDRNAHETRSIDDCYFQIGGQNYVFERDTLQLGIAPNAGALHITDDWALARLEQPVDKSVPPQPAPKIPTLAIGDEIVKVTMVSPAGHGNFNGPSSIESCMIRKIDPPSEDGIRRARHDCNDGYGGSGSGLFDEAGHLIAMQSASLDMNRRLAFDIEHHYGSALLIEGRLRSTISDNLDRQP